MASSKFLLVSAVILIFIAFSVVNLSRISVTNMDRIQCSCKDHEKNITKLEKVEESIKKDNLADAGIEPEDRTNLEEKEDVKLEENENLKKKNTKKNAFIFYATESPYFVMTLHHCFKLFNLTGMAYDCVILINNNIKLSNYLDDWDNVPLRIITTDNTIVRNNNAYYRNSINKLSIFDQTQYDQLIYFDSDAELLKAPTELFTSLPEDVIVAAPLAYWELDNCINSQFIYLKPNHDVYNNLIKFGSGRTDFDMDILNHYFGYKQQNGMWYFGDLLVLPYNYVCLTHKNSSQFFHNYYHPFHYPRRICHGSYVMHFSEGGKPWGEIRSTQISPEVQEIYRYIHDDVLKRDFRAILAENDKINNTKGHFPYTFTSFESVFNPK